MLINLSGQFSHQVLVQLLLSLLHLREEVHDLAPTGVRYHTVGLLNNLLGHVNITAHILRAHLLKALLLVLELGFNFN